MTLTFLVSVTLDEVRLREDRPPEGVGVELRDEIASHLHSLHDVFAVTRVTVAAIPDGEVGDRLCWAAEPAAPSMPPAEPPGGV